MKDRYLEIIYRKGKPLAAYFYLHRRHGCRCVRSAQMGNGLIADYDDAGVAVGLEITSPTTVTVGQVKEALEKLEGRPVSEQELAPLKAA